VTDPDSILDGLEAVIGAPDGITSGNPQCSWGLTDIGDLPTSFMENFPDLTIPNGQEFYYCQAYYLSFMEGWSGTITYQAFKRNGSPASYCTPVEAWEINNGIFPKVFANLLYSTNFPLTVANSCPQP
jgi:hypothetical protein